MTLRLATGPVCWGVDFAGAPGNPPPERVLDGARVAGFRWLELGPLGYLPRDLGGLGLTAGFVFERLDRDRSTLEAVASATAARVAAGGGRFLVIIDAVADGARDRNRLLRGIEAVAGVAQRHGLHPVVHPHAGTGVQSVHEIEAVMTVADLCLDTGHLAFAGIDPIEAYRAWAARVPYLHLKDVDPERVGGGFWPSVRRGAFRPIGEGAVDFGALLTALADHGYDGWAVVEQDRVAGEGDPVGDLIAARSHLEAIRA